MIQKKQLKSRFSMPILGIGTYGIGGGHSRDDSNDTNEINAIKTALRFGYTHIDTAEMYGEGHSEELIKIAISGIDRENLFIASKVLDVNLKYDCVISSLQNSLKRLNLTYLDLYLIHSFNPDIPLKETMEALNHLVGIGLIKNIGVCNFSIGQLKEAQKNSKAKIVVNQMKFNLWAKEGPDINTMQYCRENDIMITAYKLFGRGKIISEPPRIFLELAEKYNKTPAQIMTNWVLSNANTVTIFTSRSEKHLIENIDATKFLITPEDLRKLDKELLSDY